MKREIVCMECSKNRLFYKEYVGEWCKKVKGEANHDVFCDRCGREVNKGDECFAVSSGLNSQPYYKWEKENLK